MKPICAILCLLCCCSCELFQTKTVSEAALVDQKMAEINMKEVDVYPMFPDCDEKASKFAQQKCFESQIAAVYAQVLAQQHFVVEDDISDTVYVYLLIDKNGEILFQKTEKSDSIAMMLPQLDSLLQKKTDSLPHIFPAQKQGIKVASKFVLPIVVSSEY